MHENCMVLNGVCVVSVGLNNTEYYKLKSTGSDLDRSRLGMGIVKVLTVLLLLPILLIDSVL